MADYTTIDRPYDAVGNRTPGGTSPVMGEVSNLFNQPAEASSYNDPTATGTSTTADANYVGTQTTQTVAGAVETQQVNSNQSLANLWITSFIRSKNWKPGAMGFNIDGQTGNAEFNDVTVRGTIYATAGVIGGWTINATTITASGLTLDSAGSIGTSTFVSGQTGWNISATGTAEFNNIIARGEFRTAVLTKDEVHATGGSFLVLGASVLLNNFTSVTSPTTSALDLKDPPSGHTQLFVVNDIVRIKDGSGLDNWLKVTAVSDQTTFYRYTVDKQSGTNGTFYPGTGVINYKQATDGFVMMTSDMANAPYVDIGLSGATPWTATTPKARLGNLSGITDPVFGALSGYGLWTANGYFSGSLFATTGYFGNQTNGISIDSNGITVTGTGYIRTGSSGSRIEIKGALDGGSFVDGIDGYDSGGTAIFRLAMGGGNPMLSILGNANQAGAQILNSNSSNSTDALTVTEAGLANGIKITTSGSTSRSSVAALYIDQAADVGYGAYIKGGTNTAQELLHIEGINQTGDIYYAKFVTPRTNHREARITGDNYLQFPAHYHLSEFDEYLSAGSTILSSSVIAKSYWVGSGTNGTQTLMTGDAATDKNTYIELATTAAANSTSVLTFGRFMNTAVPAIEFRFLVDSITNKKINLGLADGTADYAFLTFDTALDANKFYTETRHATGAITSTQRTATLTASTWRTVRIQIYSASVVFYVDDVLIGTNSASIPTNAMKPYFYVDNKAVAQNNLLDIDYVKIWSGRIDS